MGAAAAMSEVFRLNLLCVIAFMPLQSQEYNVPNGKQNTNEMEALNRYNEMHTKDYGEFSVLSCRTTFL